MPEATNLVLFLAAAVVLAVMPGPGILYVGARTLAGGRQEGLASSFGTALGGMVQVVAGAVGLSALLLASAEAFTLVKLLGAAYLVWLGIVTFRAARDPFTIESVSAIGSRRAFRDGALVETLNPKTAAFFMAFLPQFVDPAVGPVAVQFVLFGTFSVVLNTLADVVVAYCAGELRAGLARRSLLLRRLREASGITLCGLGIALAFARRPT
ncbi:MAG: LysE family translocator [Hyphomicrobiaceae bacterium]